MTPEEKRIRPERLHNERRAGTRLTRRVATMDGEPVAEGEIYRNPPAELIARILPELYSARAGRSAGSHVSEEDIDDALVLLDRARRELENAELSLIRAARGRRFTWKRIASRLDLDSPQAAAQRLERLERRSFPAGWEDADAGYIGEPDDVVVYDEHHRRTPGGGHTCEHDVRAVGCTHAHAHGYPAPFDERAIIAAQCRACQGQGFTMTTCPTCGGSGTVLDGEHDQRCRPCLGQGLLRTDCPTCQSTGKATAAPAASAGPAPFEEPTPQIATIRPTAAEDRDQAEAPATPDVAPLPEPGRVVDLAQDSFGYPGQWRLIESEHGSWRLEHDGTRVGVIRRGSTSSGRRGWQAILTSGITLRAEGTLAVTTASGLWTSRDLAAAGVAHHLTTA